MSNIREEMSNIREEEKEGKFRIHESSYDRLKFICAGDAHLISHPVFTLLTPILFGAILWGGRRIVDNME